MTESPDPRVDLRALDEPADPQQVDRVMRAVMARVAATPRRGASPAGGSVWDDLAAWLRPGLAAAAVVGAVAGGTLAAHADGQPPDGSRAGATDATPAPGDVEAQVGEWLAARRAPTAGELLTAFRGYPR